MAEGNHDRPLREGFHRHAMVGVFTQCDQTGRWYDGVTYLISQRAEGKMWFEDEVPEAVFAPAKETDDER